MRCRDQCGRLPRLPSLPKIRQEDGNVILSAPTSGTEIEERAGHRQNALLHYRAFEALWKEADPELQGRVDRVSARIAKLAQ